MAKGKKPLTPKQMEVLRTGYTPTPWQKKIAKREGVPVTRNIPKKPGSLEIAHERYLRQEAAGESRLTPTGKAVARREAKIRGREALSRDKARLRERTATLKRAAERHGRLPKFETEARVMEAKAKRDLLSERRRLKAGKPHFPKAADERLRRIGAYLGRKGPREAAARVRQAHLGFARYAEAPQAVRDLATQVLGAASGRTTMHELMQGKGPNKYIKAMSRRAAQSLNYPGLKMHIPGKGGVQGKTFRVVRALKGEEAGTKAGRLKAYREAAKRGIPKEQLVNPKEWREAMRAEKVARTTAKHAEAMMMTQKIKERLKAVGSTIGKTKVAKAAVAAAKSPAGRMAGKVLGTAAKLTSGSAAMMPYSRKELEKRAGAPARLLGRRKSK